MRIAIINGRNDDVIVHKAGCRDIAREERLYLDKAWELEVDSRFEAFENYNSDFIAEAEAEGEEDIYYNTYPLTFKPCVGDLPWKA